MPLDETAGTPREIWQDYFSKRRPAPNVVRDMVLEMHESGRHEHVIAAIEAALVNGQSQPWMYEVLALSMQIAGRPKDDVERVLLSGVDFTGADFDAMMFSAAYLARFELPAAALRMYRQASRLVPVRPEPYVLSVKLAQQSKDYDTLAWAAAGVLTYAWTGDHARLHQQAEDAVRQAQQELRGAGKTDEAEALEAAVAQARQRDLVLRLSWNGVGDVDLLVEEPLGSICSVDAPHSPGGGVLVHDGYGPDQNNCFDEYVCAFGSPGTYRVKIRHVWGHVVGKRVHLTIVRYLGTPQESTRTLTIPLDARDRTVRVMLPEGRRTERTPVPVGEVARTAPRRKSRPSLLQMVGRMTPEARRSGRRFSQSRNEAGGGMPGAPGVGFTPIIQNISEGVTLAAQAVVSGDRRYVRLSLQPNFNTITDVFTFNFLSGQSGGGGGGGIRSGGGGGGGGAGGPVP